MDVRPREVAIGLQACLTMRPVVTNQGNGSYPSMSGPAPQAQGEIFYEFGILANEDLEQKGIVVEGLQIQLTATLATFLPVAARWIPPRNFLGKRYQVLDPLIGQVYAIQRSFHFGYSAPDPWPCPAACFLRLQYIQPF